MGGNFNDVGFLCVCVDSDALRTAVDFSRNYFRGAPKSLINAYIDSQADFPSFQAQLGCQGFIIFDGAGQMKVPSTAPFMQHRDRAFRDVEGKLRAILPRIQPPIGRKVRVAGLTSAKGLELNGRLGEVLGASGHDRWLVQLEGADTSMAMRPENLDDAMVGRRVRVGGLSSAKGSALNGQVGEVAGRAESGRLLVRLCADTVAIRAENLEELSEAEQDQEDLAAVASVHHEGMDKDHEACAEALRDLLRILSVPSLRKARDELAEHFEREETLLRESGFGAAMSPDDAMGSKFSAMEGHVGDHQRIIAIADEALGKLDGACDSIEGAVPKVVATDLCRAFREHANLYDSLYAEKLAGA